MIQYTTRRQPNHVGILSRAGARILTAGTEAELHELLAECVSELYQRVRHCETFANLGGELAAAPNQSEAQAARGSKLLAALRGRLHAQIVPAGRGRQHGSIMAAPLLHSSRMLGLVVVEAQADAPDFGPLEGTLLEGLASLFSPAFHRIRAKDDLTAVRQTQRPSLPGRLPEAAGVVVHAEHLPAGEVGGDFYDVVCAGDGQVMAVIGGVSGNGVPAALLLSRISADFRRLASLETSPAKLLERIDRQMASLEDERFVTAVCVRIDARSRTLTVANAGHAPPMIRRATGEVSTFGVASGMPLGMQRCGYVEEEIGLEPSDIVLLMTSGLLESLDRQSDRLGTKLLTSLLAYVPHEPKALCQRVLAAAGKMRGAKLAADATLVALQISRASSPA